MDPRQYGPQIFPARRDTSEDRSRGIDDEQARNAVPAWAGDRDRTRRAAQGPSDADATSRVG